MATRTIVTSQPDVECEVCARRLLRGEQPNVFLAAGRRRIVCELCAPRATHEGWLRETDGQSLNLAPMRPRRGRSLFELLPVPFRMRQVAEPAGEAPGGALGDGRELASTESAGAHETASYDLFDRAADAASASASVSDAVAHVEAAAETESELVDCELVEAVAHEQPSAYVEEAIAVFNASEFPRRVAGVTRSLGAPSVSVRSAEHLSSVVSIVVAWELCWYRYEVDLSESVVEAQVIAQGTELAELAREDRVANAAAAEVGTLVFTGAYG
jgi:hypothetical protein